MKVLKVICTTVLLLYILVLVLVYAYQDKLLFFPQHLDKNFRYAALTENDQEVFVQTGDGKLINGILYRRPGNQNIVLYFHGNAGALDSWQEISDEILRLGCDLLIMDYRGYGKSEGTFSEQGFYEDAHAAYKFLMKEGYKPSQIIVYGRSLGTGVATELAVTEPTKALILESPYTSMVDIANEKMPYLLPKLLLRYRLNTFERASQLKVPVLIIHGSQDELIPCQHGQKIYGAVLSAKKLLLIPGGEHNNLAAFPGHFTGLQDFIYSLPAK